MSSPFPCFRTASPDQALPNYRLPAGILQRVKAPEKLLINRGVG